MSTTTLRFTDLDAEHNSASAQVDTDHTFVASDGGPKTHSSTGNVRPRVVWQAIKSVLTIMALAIVCATVVSLVVLGPRLLVPGFLVAFMMIMFIGMPLILASITDAVEQDAHAE